MVESIKQQEAKRWFEPLVPVKYSSFIVCSSKYDANIPMNNVMKISFDVIGQNPMPLSFSRLLRSKIVK